MTDSPTPRAHRLLEGALLFTLLAHAAAMITMALCLLPGLPGGTSGGIVDRAAYVASHPWLWRLGWLPWQITALSDVLLGVALLRADFIPRRAALAALLLTLVAVGFEQPAEFRWVAEGVARAGGDPADYARVEASLFLRIGAWAALFYTLAALGWTWCFAAAGLWNRALTCLSLITWPLLGAVSVGPLLPSAFRMAPGLVAAGNAVGFVLLMAWLALVAELVLRRSRPDTASGRMAPWRHPRRGLLPSLLNLAANSRLLRAYGAWLPTLAYRSDIEDVIYVNCLVEAEGLRGLVPEELELQPLGPGGHFALFTVLTYRHGHFGPALLGPLRRLMPSPVQSNWRIHVRDPRTGVRGIHFVTTVIASEPAALLARLLSEGLPMHVPEKAVVAINAEGAFDLRLDPGAGSAPDLTACLAPAAFPELPEPWSRCFRDYRDFLAYCVPQDRAMSSQPWWGRITRQEIELGIPLEACEPLAGSVVSHALSRYVGGANPLCFRVARVAFRFSEEVHECA